MIVVASITLILVLVGIGAFIYGTIQLARFAFRISTGRGIAAILFPPYTFYFAFAELEEEDKAFPTASWMFGLVVSVLLTAVFFQPLQLLLSGQFDQLTTTNPGKAARSEYGSEEEPGGTETAEEDTKADQDTGTATEPDAGDTTAAGDTGTDGSSSDVDGGDADGS